MYRLGIHLDEEIGMLMLLAMAAIVTGAWLAGRQLAKILTLLFPPKGR